MLRNRRSLIGPNAERHFSKYRLIVSLLIFFISMLPVSGQSGSGGKASSPRKTQLKNSTRRTASSNQCLCTPFSEKQVLKLLNEGRNINCQCTKAAGNTPLGVAIRFGTVEAVKLLLDHGANPNPNSDFIQSDGPPLLTAIHWAPSPETVKMLLEAGANPNARDLEGKPAIIVAAYKNYQEIVRLLIKHGADVNAASKDSAGEAALHKAAWKGHLEIAKLLLDNGAKIDFEDRHQGDTPLQTAARYGHERVVELLIKRGASLNARNLKGYTALDEAREHSFTKIVKMLVKAGGKVDPDCNAVIVSVREILGSSRKCVSEVAK